jgi:hypothetical protein
MDKSSPVHFDESLPALLDGLHEQLGDAALAATVVIRDVSGRLAAFIDADLAEERVELAAAAIRARLGAYARPDRVLASREAPGAKRIFREATDRGLPVRINEGLIVRLLDRRVAGTDWLQAPSPQAQPHPAWYSPA